MATDWLGLYLEEDLGPDGDITSTSIFADDEQGAARMVLREAGFVAGVHHAAELFERLGATATVHYDGAWVDAGSTVLTVEGPVRAILTGERVALNLVGRMSGIATQTRRLVESLAAACSSARVAATRKTTPGFRFFEKEAVAAAGGDPHRAGLWDEAMIKDNHRDAAGDVAAAVRAVKTAWPDRICSTEVESMDDARAAAAAGTDWLLIDNQTPEEGLRWAEAVWKDHPGVKIEASGGITPDTIAGYGWADRISLGALTHQAQSLDVGLDWGITRAGDPAPAAGHEAR